MGRSRLPVRGRARALKLANFMRDVVPPLRCVQGFVTRTASVVVVVAAVAVGVARWLAHVPAFPPQHHPVRTISGFWSPEQMASLEALVEGLGVYPVAADDMTSTVTHVRAVLCTVAQLVLLAPGP
jgi:hypothetical protein